MPVYVYRCPMCNAAFEERRQVAERNELAKCPTCGDDQASRRYVPLRINLGHSDDPGQDYQFKYLDDKERAY